MPRTELTVQTMSRDGLAATYDAADSVNNHEFVNDGVQTFLHVKAAGPPTTITPIIQQQVDGQTVDPRDIVVGAATEEFIGPFPAAIYNTSDGKCEFDISPPSSVTLAAVKVGT